MKLTDAMRAKKYRDKQKSKGIRTGGKGGKNSKWDTGEFIALDGEGESIGETEIFEVESGGKTYSAKEHIYTLLAASSGEALYNGGERLETMACIDFLLDLSDAHKKAIFVIFAGSYDINHMLMFGLERSQLARIASGDTLRYEHDGVKYEIEYRPRKSLTLRRGGSFVRNKNNKWVMNWQSKMVIWDVFGFFQENFVAVMRKWLGESHKHFALIKRMKAMRGDFANVAQHDINAYNRAELECLVELMNKVRDAISGLGLKCNRWDGAGAVAAALMRKHNVREFKCDTPTHIVDAVRTAYAGGRIEVCKIGVHNDIVYDYDINSAYPNVMKDLPCLAHGQWIEGDGDTAPPEGFTLVHCEFQFASDLPFYPLFYRTNKMQISFPSEGEGIYWLPEYKAALDCPGIVTVIKWWHFKPNCYHKPFHWIEDYYKTRQQWVKNPLEEWQSGGEKIIKLGLNSLYGKTAQQLGGRNDRQPAYHQLEWAGYITSATRARLYSAGILQSDAVIGFATDGIFTTSPLALCHSEEKTLGAWDVKKFNGLTLAMAGVYWWHDGDYFKHFSRGFDKEAMESPAHVIEAWRKGHSSLDVPLHRLIGLGSACASDTFFAMRGRFTTGMRSLQLDGQSFKRNIVNVKKTKPHKKMVNTTPKHNIIYNCQLQGCSHPYPLEWLRDPDFKEELEINAENVDTHNI
jgi:hypothetical protein